MRLALLIALAWFATAPVQAQPIPPSDAYLEIAAQIATQVTSWCGKELPACLDELFSREPGKLDYPEYPDTGTRDTYGAPIDGVYRLETISGGSRDRWDVENRNTSMLLVLNGKYFRVYVGSTRSDPSRYTAYGNQGKIGIRNRPSTIIQEKTLVKPGGKITFWDKEVSYEDTLTIYRNPDHSPDRFEITSPVNPADGHGFREVWEPITRESAANGWFNLLLGF